jgi:hypothetical protein
MRNVEYVLLILLAFSGCDNIQIGKPKEDKVEVKSVEVKLTESLTKVVDAAKTLSQSDKDFAFKQFSGMSEYINNSNLPDSTKIDQLLARMQGDYGWTREKNLDFTNAVSAYLKEQGYKAVKFDSAESRNTTSLMFFNLAEAVKKSEESK